MRARTGFTYLLVLFAVTGICLSALRLGEVEDNPDGLKLSHLHIVKPDVHRSFVVHKLSAGTYRTTVWVVRRAANTVDIQALNPTDHDVGIKLEVDRFEPEKYTTSLPGIAVGLTKLLTLDYMPEKVLVQFILSEPPNEASISQGPAASISQAPTDNYETEDDASSSKID
ncbi:hypothetical protein PTTG_06923 [Puccinia triticina 1-1 BBBD Race 1]|uniref:Uncharacterized protein n=2 Tax=Puccinia triticina TaxID=208348 RepID=A0A0C4F1F3_PUCT1|nr:uncharacterized protein PtA15_13A424 [Puccinia triticina]OAV89351.1 hypothetical protein PTTG_06923 [Puccinia triticina 1-1 BBBD Race 1]WAQ91024.1 hypothetical protein PtA15_13A424 [Puccinia triticina]WAR61218.1 hypothetical protein PtB15_13B470 [Puccinia triticina]